MKRLLCLIAHSWTEWKPWRYVVLGHVPEDVRHCTRCGRHQYRDSA